MSELRREDVLDALRAYADEHGVVPGRKTFLAHSGFPRGVFEGRFWARFGDAVREAGLEPQTSPDRIDEEAAVAAYAQLTRELGRIPTHADMRLQGSLDPEFPSRQTIIRRVGNTTAERVDRLREWSAKSSDFADVLSLLPPETSASDVQPDEGVTADLRRDGYVYLLKSGRLYKIGMSYSVPRRWAEIDGASPEEVDLVHHIKTDDPSGIEAYWHRRFAHLRKGGEWFALSASDVAAFRRRRSFM